MEGARKALPKYFAILDGQRKARFLECDNLKDKVFKAKSFLSSCMLCERRCGVDRSKGERGFCGVLEPRISSKFIHLGEEPEIVPSYTIFFAGCTFHCVFCQNWDISQNPNGGVELHAETLANMMNNISARNVNWVGGDPTPNIPFILEVLINVEKNLPQVWNSNLYLTKEAMGVLDGVIDLYLTDFKYGCDECAVKYSQAKDYWKIITRNHFEARRQAEVIIRHLVLPGHVDCCTKPILDWISDNLENVRVNIMDQYRPEYKACDYPEINTLLSTNEFREALDYGRELGLNIVR
ncbi:MAG: radical SAM protein [Methanobacteriota archaeon]